MITSEKIFGFGNVVVRYRFLFVIGVVIAAAGGFLGGRIFQRQLPSGIPGLQDYLALTQYNHYSVVRANGPSMQPTLAAHNVLLVRDTQQIHRGDILVTAHHGIHRVVGMPGETISLVGGHVRVCSPRTGQPASCRTLHEPGVQYYRSPPQNAGPVFLGHGYGTVPDNRSCCEFIIVVPADDVVGVVAGSLVSYGPLAPAGRIAPTQPLTCTLVYSAS